MNRAVLQALDKGTCVITATRRLAYELKTTYDNQQIKLGQKVWPTARILTWDGWMQALWHELGSGTTLLVLNNAQLQQLLNEFIEADLNRRESQAAHNLAALWNIPATARTALDAWQLCHQWRISFNTLQISEQADHAHFGRWATRLYARLSEQNWISPVQLPDQLIAAGFKTRQGALLFGFDYLNTQQHHFIEFYREQGAELTLHDSKATASSKVRRFCFDSPQAEWQQIGAWARDILLNNPQTKIGIITPDTNDIRAVAEHSLREQITPAYFQHPSTDPFHFSIAGTLSDQPVINGALACLDLLGALGFKQLSGIF
jgi:ATP-dependent helicase/nuclease subunit B